MSEVMREYPMDNLRARGHWVARVDGPDDKYGVARSFLNGATKGRERHYGPVVLGAPAWILRASAGWCDGCGRDFPVVELIGATELGWVVVATGLVSADLLKVWEGGPPGADPVGQVEAVLGAKSADLDRLEDLAEVF